MSLYPQNLIFLQIQSDKMGSQDNFQFPKQTQYVLNTHKIEYDISTDRVMSSIHGHEFTGKQTSKYKTLIKSFHLFLMLSLFTCDFLILSVEQHKDEKLWCGTIFSSRQHLTMMDNELETEKGEGRARKN